MGRGEEVVVEGMRLTQYSWELFSEMSSRFLIMTVMR